MHNGGLERSGPLLHRSVRQDCIQLAVEPHHQHLLLLNGIVSLSDLVLIALHQAIPLGQL